MEKKKLIQTKMLQLLEKWLLRSDYLEAKKLDSFSISLLLYVCSYALVVCSHSKWILDTGATRHISVEKEGLMDYHRMSVGTQYVTLGNGTQERILGVSSYQLKMKNGKSLFLKEIMYALRVQIFFQ